MQSKRLVFCQVDRTAYHCTVCNDQHERGDDFFLEHSIYSCVRGIQRWTETRAWLIGVDGAAFEMPTVMAVVCAPEVAA